MTPFYWRGRILLCRATDAILGWYQRHPGSNAITAHSWPFHPEKRQERWYKASFTVTQDAERWLVKQAHQEPSA